MPTVYPDEVSAVLSACLAYQRGQIELDKLKTEVWAASQAVLVAEEAEFRRFLQAAEGRFDMAQFTSDDVRASALVVVEEIEQRIKLHLA